MSYSTSIVLVPYKITLLSNAGDVAPDGRQVLVPYKITLLSNECLGYCVELKVLVPYKITLLSNVLLIVSEDERFSTL